ncbi:MAG: hypothetical protein Tsb0021_12080 [Chlamydiales bacterium]
MSNRNWSQYNKKLVQRGSITFLIDPKMFPKFKSKKQKHKIGRPIEYSDNPIFILLMLKIQFGLTYRRLQGFAQSALSNILKVCIPDYTLICKRAKALQHMLPNTNPRKKIHK